LKVKVLLFGALKDAAGNEQLQWDNVEDVNSLMNQLFDKYPLLSEGNFKIAVNLKLETSNLKLNDGDVVALLPQFSGG
jgi:molybdopterin converting factor small subunit